MTAIVFESLLPVFLVILVGLLLRKYSVIPEPQWRGIEALGYWLLFPVLVMVSLINMDLKNIDLGAITWSYLSAVFIHVIAIWLLRRPLLTLFAIDDRSFSSVFQTATRWNAFIALAIASKFAGEQGIALVALVMAITIALLNFINIVALTILTSDTKPTFRQTFINTIKVPLIWGAFLGLVLNLTEVPIYEPLMVSLDIIARAGLGIGLLTVGAGIRISAMRNAKINVSIGIAAKLFFFPLIVFICCLAFNVQGLALQIVMLCASVSTAMNGYVLAREMGGDADLYASTASLQVVISMFSIPLILWLVTTL